MKLVDEFRCAVPIGLAPFIRQVATQTGRTPISVGRMPEAAPILNKYGVHTQKQLWDASPAQRAAWGVLGTPNRPGTSTHECRSDGVAYPGPVGRRLAGWQCGMDWPNDSIAEVMAAFRAQGLEPIHPYVSGLEYHHLNLAKKPRLLNLYLPLGYNKPGHNKGVFVGILTSRLVTCGYLKQRTRTYDRAVRDAVKQFQLHHHLTADGITGTQTWVNLKSAARMCKRLHKQEV